MTSKHPVRRRGHTNGSFLRKLTMVCLIALVVSGLVVYWIGETTPPRTADHPPAVRQSGASEEHAGRHVHEQAQRREGGVGCGGRA